MIELRNVSRNYFHKKMEIPVLKNFSLSVGKGEVCCVSGGSGSGKSTLLHIIGGMLMPSAGSVIINSTELSSLPLHFLSLFRRENIGFIFQQFNLLKKYTVKENILFPFVPTNTCLKMAEKKVRTLLELLRVDHRMDFPVCRLSGGEQQRVAVARALVMEPKVIIADEPFSNLDPENSEIISNIFEELKEKGTTIILSSTANVDDGPDNRLVDRCIDTFHVE